MTRPCVNSVAITGSVATKNGNPAVPITVSEQVESVQEPFEAGAAIAHCPGMIIQFSTGGRSGAAGCFRRGPTWRCCPWGRATSRPVTTRTRQSWWAGLAPAMRADGMTPEIEAFDLLHIHQAVAMNRHGRAPGQLYVQFVIGR
ncbi:3-keto-5-aminohexanoate cleavage protein [Tropicimonas aquimaris]|uniref:3-keto-5-aminohexanoate cleavage protein n=1 Tax=Tropicimonas aquimaris TaxID=914152 RepID=A0ABW3IR54_9RHOB